ncbi:hypothetical protein [Streptomyces sp. NPDC095613]|uniref:hypothetical protein n=1 Tax=Streptomyces sp. NPDC095613 TaxID=3155540 RepID=UPI0033211B50
MSTADMPFEGRELAAAVEDAFADVAPDPAQVGVNLLHTTLYFRDFARSYLDRQPHRQLIADIEDHFAAIEPDSYLDDVFAGDCPEASAAAYEQLVTQEWDGDL